jgi:hypothetical protein
VIQQVFIIVIFTFAVGYLVRMVIKSFKANECATGCGKCGAVDFKKIEEQLKEKGL